MKTQSKLVADISPQGRVISSEIQKGVFNRTYMAFILVLVAVGGLMGFTVSQLYETQKDLKALTTQYEINNIYLAKLGKEQEKK